MLAWGKNVWYNAGKKARQMNGKQIERNGKSQKQQFLWKTPMTSLAPTSAVAPTTPAISMAPTTPNDFEDSNNSITISFNKNTFHPHPPTMTTTATKNANNDDSNGG